MPAWRASGCTSIANTQPQGGEPNSQSRTSPIMKPTMRCARHRHQEVALSLPPTP